MDDRRFDALTRALATGSSRRAVLRALAGVVVGGAGALTRDEAGRAARCRGMDEICRKGGDCCSKVCQPADATGRQRCGCATAADCPTPVNKCLKAACIAGTCGTETAVVCTALDQCHVAGICDPATGVCSNPAAANGTVCDDGNACTTNDTCQAGVCQPGAPVSCPLCHTCSSGQCVPAGGDARCSGPGQACCGGECIDVSSDEQHCGGCPNVCPPNFVCLGGVFQSVPPPGECKTYGNSCAQDADCCNLRCTLGTCICTTPLVFPSVNIVPPCTQDEHCCSGKCIMVEGVGGCTLLPIGAPCDHPWHCLTGNCNDGICSPFA